MDGRVNSAYFSLKNKSTLKLSRSNASNEKVKNKNRFKSTLDSLKKSPAAFGQGNQPRIPEEESIRSENSPKNNSIPVKAVALQPSPAPTPPKNESQSKKKPLLQPSPVPSLTPSKPPSTSNKKIKSIEKLKTDGSPRKIVSSDSKSSSKRRRRLQKMVQGVRKKESKRKPVNEFIPPTIKVPEMTDVGKLKAMMIARVKRRKKISYWMFNTTAIVFLTCLVIVILGCTSGFFIRKEVLAIKMALREKKQPWFSPCGLKTMFRKINGHYDILNCTLPTFIPISQAGLTPWQPSCPTNNTTTTITQYRFHLFLPNATYINDYQTPLSYNRTCTCPCRP